MTKKQIKILIGSQKKKINNEMIKKIGAMTPFKKVLAEVYKHLSNTNYSIYPEVCFASCTWCQQKHIIFFCLCLYCDICADDSTNKDN